jgi:hypothetical protein
MDDPEFLFFCPITNNIFEDPVKAEDGRTYERDGIEAWFASCRKRNLPVTSPWTREEIGTELKSDPEAASGAQKLREELAKSGNNGTIAADVRAALGNIASIYDLRKIFAALDPLRGILEKSLDGWQPPQLVVIGEENSGKSSVLERIAMMPIFPRNHRLCTRLPVHVRLRNAEKFCPATLEVFNTRTHTTEEEAYVIPTEFGSVDVRDKMQEIISKEYGDVARAVSTERIIILTIRSPHVPSIDLIDMPGFVSTPEDLKNRTRKLVEQHISKHGQHSLFLATVRATVAPNTSVALDIVQSKKLQSRTVGVFSMCDHAVAVPDCRQAFLERLQARPPPDCGAVDLDPYGWVCVMNAKSSNKEDNDAQTNASFARLKDQAFAEDEFMREKLPALLLSGNAGCGALIERLSRQFMQFLKDSWGPKTVKLLHEALHDARVENIALGLPAYHTGGLEQSAQARQGAVDDAKSRLETGKKIIVQGCCGKMLGSLKKRLQGLTAARLVNMDPSELSDLWKKQRDEFEIVCEEAVTAWISAWIESLREMLQQPQQAPATKPDSVEQEEDAASFELGRFPAFITAIVARVTPLMEPIEERILQDIIGLIDKFYGPLSPWVTVTVNLESAPATASLNYDPNVLIDNVIMCFIKYSNTIILADLPPSLHEIASQVLIHTACVNHMRDHCTSIILG